jgi:hypothetical protein
MPGDPQRPVVESYAALARTVLDRPARVGHSRLVAVDGPSGAGKTVFAGRLADALAAVPGTVRPPVVHTDDLLDGWADQFTFWPRLESWVLEPLREGRAGSYRRYSWVRRRFTGRPVRVPAAPVVIIEGVSAARAAVAPELTLGVFVTAPLPVRQARTLVRDGPAAQPYLAVWRAGEEPYFAADRTGERVELVVDSAATIPHDPVTHFVRLC